MKRFVIVLALALALATTVVVSAENVSAGWEDGARTSGIGWCSSC